MCAIVLSPNFIPIHRDISCFIVPLVFVLLPDTQGCLIAMQQVCLVIFCSHRNCRRTAKLLLSVIRDLMPTASRQHGAPLSSSTCLFAQTQCQSNFANQTCGRTMLNRGDAEVQGLLRSAWTLTFLPIIDVLFHFAQGTEACRGFQVRRHTTPRLESPR